ncbi:MAG: VOC family protein [Halobacteriaceae archaeon]
MPGLPDDTRLGHVALRVPDLDAAVAFYETVVGLAVLDRAPEGEPPSATLGAGGEPLLVLRAPADAPPRGPAEAGLFHAAFRLPSRAALGDALARVREHAALEGASDHAVSEALYLSDPAGNGVELYRDRPREAWPTTGGRVDMVTEPLDLEAVAAAADADGRGPDDVPDSGRAPPGTDLGHVHLEVTDLAATRAFYVDDLGFDVSATVPSGLFLAAGGYHHYVGANTWRGRTAPATRGARGLAWVEVVLPDAGALADCRDRLDGAHRDVTLAAGGERGEGAERGGAITVRDPDGIAILLRSADASGTGEPR